MEVVSSLNFDDYVMYYLKVFRKVFKKQLVNSVNQKGASIECEFSIGKNHYKVHRTIKTYGSQPFEIYINDKLVDQTGDSRDYQEYLENNILKLNFKSFTQIVILGSSSFIPFMQLRTIKKRDHRRFIRHKDILCNEYIT